MYTPVNYTSKIVVRLMRLIYQTPDEAWMPYYNFMALPVPQEIIDNEPMLVELAKKREFHAGILKMDPNSCYNWHVDTDRHVSLNMLVLDDGSSHCIFAPEYGLVMPIHELKYAPFTYYVFNTKVPHMVVNFNEPRYMFSLEFLGKDKDVTYEELLVDIQGLNYVN